MKKILFLLSILLFFLSCTSKRNKTIHYITDDSYKYWENVNVDTVFKYNEDSTQKIMGTWKTVFYFDNKGTCLVFRKTPDGRFLSHPRSCLPEKKLTWTLKNDSLIIFNNSSETAIIELNDSIFITKKWYTKYKRETKEDSLLRVNLVPFYFTPKSYKYEYIRLKAIPRDSLPKELQQYQKQPKPLPPDSCPNVLNM